MSTINDLELVLKCYKEYLRANRCRLVLKKYSKTMWGNYNPNNKRITIYVGDENGKLLPFSILLKTLVHEICHYEQWENKSFKRTKGVMHDVDFYYRYNNHLNYLRKRSEYYDRLY